METWTGRCLWESSIDASAMSPSRDHNGSQRAACLRGLPGAGFQEFFGDALSEEIDISKRGSTMVSKCLRAFGGNEREKAGMKRDCRRKKLGRALQQATPSGPWQWSVISHGGF